MILNHNFVPVYFKRIKSFANTIEQILVDSLFIYTLFVIRITRGNLYLHNYDFKVIVCVFTLNAL